MYAAVLLIAAVAGIGGSLGIVLIALGGERGSRDAGRCRNHAHRPFRSPAASSYDGLVWRRGAAMKRREFIGGVGDQ